jgi:hypothetical protein
VIAGGFASNKEFNQRLCDAGGLWMEETKQGYATIGDWLNPKTHVIMVSCNVVVD